MERAQGLGTGMIPRRTLAGVPVVFLRIAAILMIALSFAGDILFLNGHTPDRLWAFDERWAWAVAIGAVWQVFMFIGQWGCKAAGLQQWWWLYTAFLILSVVPSVLGFWPIAHPALVATGLPSAGASVLIWIAFTGNDIMPEWVLLK